MGAAFSKSEDISKQIVNSVLSIQNEISNTCSSAVNQDNEFILDLDHTTFKSDKIELKNYANFDSKCLISSELDNKIKQEVDNKAKQIAESVNKGLNIGLNVSTAKVTSEQITNLSTALRNIVTNKCQNTFVQTNKVAIKAKDSDVYIGTINMENNLTALTDCVMKNITKNDAYISIKNTVDQAAKASNEGINFNWIIIIVAIIAIVIIFGALLGGKKSTPEQVKKINETPALPQLVSQK